MNMCNLFLFHLHDHFHWFKFPVRFNGKIKHGWSIRLERSTNAYKHTYTRSHVLTNENKLFCELDPVQMGVCVCGVWCGVNLFILYDFRERTDAHCIREAIPFICLLPLPPAHFGLCRIEDFMQNKQTVLKLYGNFLWLNLFFFFGMHVFSNKRKWR